MCSGGERFLVMVTLPCPLCHPISDGVWNDAGEWVAPMVRAILKLGGALGSIWKVPRLEAAMLRGQGHACMDANFLVHQSTSSYRNEPVHLILISEALGSRFHGIPCFGYRQDPSS